MNVLARRLDRLERTVSKRGGMEGCNLARLSDDELEVIVGPVASAAIRAFCPAVESHLRACGSQDVDVVDFARQVLQRAEGESLNEEDGRFLASLPPYPDGPVELVRLMVSVEKMF